MLPRQRWEQEEYRLLSPYAMKSDKSTRDFPIESCPLRTDFQRDRDRILHSKAFRRLKHKTQVFLSPEGDHYRTRLTHTLEVSQIARTVARVLMLNEDLAEAIALGHDLGHTPYGHAGEEALNECCPHGYTHAEQSVRVVELLENNGRGLNLTKEVRDGIRCHSSGRAKTLEGRLVLFSDKIAYMNHDIDDAVRAQIIKESDIPQEIRNVLGQKKSQRIETFISSLVESSVAEIKMSDEVTECYLQLKGFLFEAVYRNPIAKGEESKAKEMLTSLYNYFVENADRLPNEYTVISLREGIDKAVCDYISGMTDRYAVAIYEDIFIPKSWTKVR